MEWRLDEVERWARDLRRDEPRPPGKTLGGFPMAARCLDKCRASLVGWEGEHRYGCPLDREFLNAARIGVEEFRDLVATGASDIEVDKWIRLHTYART